MSSAIAVVLFDIDGTLVDSNDAHARSWVDAAAALDVPLTFATVRPLIGMGGDKLLERIGLDPAGDRGKALAARRKSIFLERYAGTLRAQPGARALVEHLRAQGLRTIVASAASREELEPLLQLAGVQASFDHIVQSHETGASKPDPDIIDAALAWARCAPPQAVMIGDTRYDIEAAHHAQVRCIAVRSGGAPADDLAAAELVVDSAAALEALLARQRLDELLAVRA